MNNDESRGQPSSRAADPSIPRWATMHLWHMQPVRDVLLVLGLVMLIIIGQATSVVTVPLLLAILLAYLFEPVIVWLMRRVGLSRRVSVMSIIASVILLVIIPAAIAATYALGQLVNFAGNTIAHIEDVNIALDHGEEEIARKQLEEQGTPGAWMWIHDEIRTAQEHGSPLGNAFDGAMEWIAENRDQVAQTAAGVSLDAVNRALLFAGAMFGLAFMVFVTIFFFFFTSTEWVQLKEFGHKLLPDKNRERATELLIRFDQVISGFIRGRITIAFIQGVIFSIGYFLIGVPGAFLLGPAVAILSIVPYLALIGLPISISLLGLQGHEGFRGEWWWVLGAPTAFYFLGQALDDYVWTPLIQGKSTGMETPTILFASLAGGALFGVFGLLIAIPIAACVKIVIQEVFWPRFKDWAEGRAEDPLPID